MMQSWFAGAKLGIFLHWGVYSVNGIPESWSFFKSELSYDDYMKQCEGFTASKYDPQAWADLFARAGARYAVLTTKHHDGVALWDTQQNDLSVVKQTPAARDLISPYCEALRERGLKVGLYYSHLDWSHPDYSPIPVRERHPDAMKQAGQWLSAPDSPEWQRFFQFHRGQLEELCTRYGPIDLLWFDGDWEPGAEYWKMAELRDQLRAWQPQAILNSRMGGHGDYETPEQGIPIEAPEGEWEFCVTVNDSWGYQTQDHNHKSVSNIVRMFCEVIGMGGNLLLAIGPREDGTITTEQTQRLEALGDWIRRHEEAVYTTHKGLPHGHFYGASTLSEDNTVLYLMLFDRPWDEIAIKGIHNDIQRVSVVGSGTQLKHRKSGGAPWVGVPGVLWIEVPENELNRNASVIKVELDGPLRLYTGSGHAVESN